MLLNIIKLIYIYLLYIYIYYISIKYLHREKKQPKVNFEAEFKEFEFKVFILVDRLKYQI